VITDHGSSIRCPDVSRQ